MRFPSTIALPVTWKLLVPAIVTSALNVDSELTVNVSVLASPIVVFPSTVKSRLSRVSP